MTDPGRTAARTATIGALSLALIGIADPGAAQVRSYIVTTASTGGTFYPVGVGMASLWTERLRDLNVRASAISSAGSAENIAMMHTGEAEFGIVGGYFVRIAYEGIEEMEQLGAVENLRTVVSLWPNAEQWIISSAAAETGTIEDVVGHRINVGRPGSGTELYSLHILRGLDIDPDTDLTFEYVGFNEAVDLMRDGRIEGANLGGGPPIAALTEAYSTLGPDAITMLEFTDDQLEAIQANSPMPMYRYTLPGGTYPGLDEDVDIIAQVTLLTVVAEVEEEVVYEMTKAIFENKDYLTSIHAIMEDINIETALDGLPAPLHPGAYDYYVEVGLDIPDELVPPERR